MLILAYAHAKWQESKRRGKLSNRIADADDDDHDMKVKERVSELSASSTNI